jgi:hypothetical protein
MIRSANFWFGLIVGAFLTIGIASHAGPVFEIGGGPTKYAVREKCALWQQCHDSLEINDEFKSWGYQVGLRFPVDSSVSVRAAFVNLGHAYFNNTWVGDGNTEHYPLRCPDVPDDCRWRGKGSVSAYGISLGPVLRDQWGAWHGELEGGAFLFRSYQKMNVCAEDGQDVPCFSYNRMYGNHRTWYVGTGFGRGPWTLNWRVYWNIYEQGSAPGGEPGITGGKTQTLFLSFAF